MTKIYAMKDKDGKLKLVRKEHVNYCKEYEGFTDEEYVGELYEFTHKADYSGYWQD